jgi:hypothetical protein
MERVMIAGREPGDLRVHELAIDRSDQGIGRHYFGAPWPSLDGSPQGSLPCDRCQIVHCQTFELAV